MQYKMSQICLLLLLKNFILFLAKHTDCYSGALQ